MADDSFKSFKVAAVHAAPIFLDRAKTIEKAVGLIEKAGQLGARFVVFPESFVPGFPYWINLAPIISLQALYIRLWENAVDMSGDARVVSPLQEAARRARAVVAIGINERAGGTLYNAQLFINEHGEILGCRRKLVPTLAERTVWGYGNGSTLRVWDTSIGKVGGLMCYEHTMNLVRQAIIAQGIQLHAAAWPGLSTLPGRETLSHQQVEVMCRTHAMTGQCFVVVAMNPIAPDVFEVMAPYIGKTELMRPGPAWSAVIHPNTSLLATETGDKDTVLVGEVNLRDIIGMKYIVDSVGHYSRPEVVSLVVNQTDYCSARFERSESVGDAGLLPSATSAATAGSTGASKAVDK